MEKSSLLLIWIVVLVVGVASLIGYQFYLKNNTKIDLKQF
jgi:hypothetical protein